MYGLDAPLDLDLHLSAPTRPADSPPELRYLRRDEVRMLVLDRRSGQRTHTRFFQLPRVLQAGDVLVVNTSATIPGRLAARHHGERLHVHLATKLSASEYILERRTANGGPDRRRFRSGDTIEIVHPKHGNTVATVTVVEAFHPNSRLWKVTSTADLFLIADTIGSPIRYNYVPQEFDKRLYQTVFARHPGSAEMPSAGRPFTHQVLRNLARSGVVIRSLLLHTGVSSHEVEGDLTNHPVLPEWYNIPPATAEAVNRAVAEGRRVVAVGTTVVRALESAVGPDGRVAAGSAWTQHLVTPDSPPRIVSGLVTGLHESQSSHLALLYAFTSPRHVRIAYEEAIAEGYLWHEFGDICLIL